MGQREKLHQSPTCRHADEAARKCQQAGFQQHRKQDLATRHADGAQQGKLSAAFTGTGSNRGVDDENGCQHHDGTGAAGH